MNQLFPRRHGSLPTFLRRSAVPVINDAPRSGPREQRGSSTPKRTHSFSSFSQLSTNSLPDIKELHPTVLSIANHRHHYHGHGTHGHHHHMQGNPLQGVQKQIRDVRTGWAHRAHANLYFGEI